MSRESRSNRRPVKTHVFVLFCSFTDYFDKCLTSEYCSVVLLFLCGLRVVNCSHCVFVNLSKKRKRRMLTYFCRFSYVISSGEKQSPPNNLFNSIVGTSSASQFSQLAKKWPGHRITPLPVVTFSPRRLG